MPPKNYGSIYFVIEVPKQVNNHGWFSVWADSVEIDSNGALIFSNHGKEKEFKGLILPRGQWYQVYAANVLCGSPIIVDRWPDGDEVEVTKNTIRTKITPTKRFKVLKRDTYKCQMCGRTEKDGVKLHIDHIVPVSSGGTDEIDNLQTLCDECNQGKGIRTPYKRKRSEIDNSLLKTILELLKSHDLLNQTQIVSYMLGDGYSKTATRATLAYMEVKKLVKINIGSHSAKLYSLIKEHKNDPNSN